MVQEGVSSYTLTLLFFRFLLMNAAYNSDRKTGHLYSTECSIHKKYPRNCIMFGTIMHDSAKNVVQIIRGVSTLFYLLIHATLFFIDEVITSIFYVSVKA